MCTLPFTKEYHQTTMSPRSTPQKKDLKNKSGLSTQGCMQGDQPIRLPELSNRHMFFCDR